MKAEAVRATDTMAKETAGKILAEEERLLAKEEAVEEQTLELQRRREVGAVQVEFSCDL
jgi:hypothetical protein